MHKAIVLSSFLAASVASVAVEAEEARQLVEMPAQMVRHMLANMRDHLAAIAEIQRALGDGEFQRASEIAEKRLGMSSLESHGAGHMANHMPEPMRDIGTQMHRAASQFALLAQDAAVDGDAGKAIGALANITEKCVACHAAYRAH